jgi:hypothetical protein
MEADTVAAGEADALLNRSPIREADGPLDPSRICAADALLNRSPISPAERRDCWSAHCDDSLPNVVTPALLGPGARP